MEINLAALAYERDLLAPLPYYRSLQFKQQLRRWSTNTSIVSTLRPRSLCEG